MRVKYVRDMKIGEVWTIKKELLSKRDYRKLRINYWRNYTMIENSDLLTIIRIW